MSVRSASQTALATAAARALRAHVVLRSRFAEDRLAEAANDPVLPNSFEKLAARVAGAGEPFVSHFTPEQIEARLYAAGFGMVEFLTPEAAATRYFLCRKDLPEPRRTTIVAARV
ncbi:MAG: hypothetical protein K9J42_14965 [Sulfuritalea sp.]|nr:hypothetical protein [Sulfuritalea sp.]